MLQNEVAPVQQLKEMKDAENDLKTTNDNKIAYDQHENLLKYAAASHNLEARALPHRDARTFCIHGMEIINDEVIVDNHHADASYLQLMLFLRI